MNVAQLILRLQAAPNHGATVTMDGAEIFDVDTSGALAATPPADNSVDATTDADPGVVDLLPEPD